MRINGKLYSKDMKELHYLHDINQLKYIDKVMFKINGNWTETTYGRLIIWELTDGLLVNEPLGKSGVKKVVIYINNHFEKNEALRRLKKLQDLGFKVATESGISLKYEDFIIPEYTDTITPLQNNLIKDENLSKIDRLKQIDAEINKKVQDWKDGIDKNNALYLMYKSGARVTDPQIRQILIAKGLLSKMDGSISNVAVAGSLGRGLNGFDYFRTCGPARRGMANNFFVVPASGYFTRQLVSTARDLQIVEDDCGDTDGIEVEIKYARGKYLVESGEVVTKEMIEADPDQKVRIRSALTCKCTKLGLCKKCVGNNPATGKTFYTGFGIGTAAAQHLSEPATQLGLRGKHTSGAVNLDEYEHGIANALLDIIHSFGGISSSFMPASYSTSYTIHDFMKEYNDPIKSAAELSKYIYNLYRNGGINVSFIWPEIVLRACTDQVKKSDGTIGLRSHGDKGKIVITNVNRSAVTYPSWLKSLGFGYVKQRLIKAASSMEVSNGCLTEQIISTKLNHYFENK